MGEAAGADHRQHLLGRRYRGRGWVEMGPDLEGVRRLAAPHEGGIPHGWLRNWEKAEVPYSTLASPVCVGSAAKAWVPLGGLEAVDLLVSC